MRCLTKHVLGKLQFLLDFLFPEVLLQQVLLQFLFQKVLLQFVLQDVLLQFLLQCLLQFLLQKLSGLQGKGRHSPPLGS